MTSIAKTSLTYDASHLVQGEAADATDVLVATNDLLENDQAGRLSVSSADTHVKNLEDALTTAGGSGIILTKQNTAANETLALAVDTAVVSTLSGAQTLTNKTIGATNAVALAALSQSGASAGEVPIWNGSAWLPGANGGGGATPVDITVTAGEALAQNDFVYLTSSNTWKKVDIDASPAAMGRWRGLVNQSGGIANAATGTVRLMGELTGFVGLTAGLMVYADSTAGSYTQTRPSPTLGGSQVAVVPIGLATSTTKILLMGPARMQYRKRASTSANGTILIEHHDDPFGDGRLPRAFVSTNDLSSIQSYSTTNVDTAVQIKGQSGAGSVITPDNSGTTSLTLGDVGGTDRRNAQQFEVTAAGMVTQVSVVFGANTGSPTGAVTVTIQTDNTDKPSGTILATTTIASPTASAVNTATFTGSPFLVTGTKYWVVWEATMQATGARYTLQSSASSTYAAGIALGDTTTGVSFTGTWGSAVAGDIRCEITVAAVALIDRVAQGVSHSSGATIGSAKFYLRKVGTPNAGTLSVLLASDSAGNPNATLATSITLDVATLTASYVLYEFVFPSPYAITGSTTYHLVLTSTSAASNTGYVEVGADTSSASYANGVAKKESSSTWSNVGGDFAFDLLAVVTSYNEPCVIGRASGGTRDVAVRYDSGSSGVNTATNTQAKNVTSGTLDITFVVEMD
jgi:hypothetical protein